MAKFPSDDLAKRHQTLSPPQHAREQTAGVTLTESARHYAVRAGVLPDLEGMSLSEASQTGDVVSLVSHGETHDFAIIRRRWIVSASGTRLEITLDHPPRQALR
ncbi:hypothetical protein MIC97_04090 [Aquamicrobium sp. NLF2-7]|uniref:hypothetical protein n=1 Tax=Aquamicrobium sp. NLF2-7 TaxID=2918753 RepID=UPI001EFB9076|nr:hypothetical protein [Aquamicrobium sp. NLF2-7]MCG8270686.1 hypothetical protein [Aquamicrobium sp. NLF2-7]